MKKNGSNRGLSPVLALGLGAALPAIAAHFSRKLVGKGYRVVANQDPPRNPAAPQVAWKDAIIWSVLTGAVGGLSRLATRRALAEAACEADDSSTSNTIEGAAESLAASVDALD